MACLARLMLAVFGCCAIVAAADDCQDSPSPCFSFTYDLCSPSELSEINSTDPAPVSVVILTPSQTDWLDPLYQSMLVLLCNQVLAPDQSHNDSMVPFCWAPDSRGVTSSVESCGSNCNCTEIQFVVFDRSKQEVLSSLQATTVLEENKLALQLRGFTVIAVSTREESSLFDVPVVSWVCVGLGLIVSALILLKPVWWDKLLVGVCVGWCRTSKAHDGDQDTQELAAHDSTARSRPVVMDTLEHTAPGQHFESDV